MRPPTVGLENANAFVARALVPNVRREDVAPQSRSAQPGLRKMARLP